MCVCKPKKPYLCPNFAKENAGDDCALGQRGVHASINN